MSIEANKGVVLEWFRSLLGGDLVRFQELTHPEFESILWGDMPASGRRDLGGFFEIAVLMYQNYFTGSFTMRIGAITAEDDRVCMEAESLAPLKNGGTYQNYYHFLFVVTDGKVRVHKELVDTLHLYRVCDGPEFQGPPQPRRNLLFDDPCVVIEGGLAVG